MYVAFVSESLRSFLLCTMYRYTDSFVGFLYISRFFIIRPRGGVGNHWWIRSVVRYKRHNNKNKPPIKHTHALERVHEARPRTACCSPFVGAPLPVLLEQSAPYDHDHRVERHPSMVVRVAPGHHLVGCSVDRGFGVMCGMIEVRRVEIQP